ncbi:MAG: hypothetical protein FWF47_04680 [Clostridia bacterium]|nr:hypothetical protein [Clostridia bacterium]
MSYVVLPDRSTICVATRCDTQRLTIARQFGSIAITGDEEEKRFPHPAEESCRLVRGIAVGTDTGPGAAG